MGTIKLSVRIVGEALEFILLETSRFIMEKMGLKGWILRVQSPCHPLAVVVHVQ